MNEMNDKIIGNVEKELDEIEIIDTESIEENCLLLYMEL